MSQKPQLHATSLNMKCMEAFRRRYVEGEIIPPGVAMVVGTGVDKAVTKNLDHKIKSRGSLLTLEEVSDIARDGLNEAWDREGVRLDPEEVDLGIKTVKGNAVDKAVRLSVLHAQAKAPEIDPTAVQRKWSLDIPGFDVDLVGTMDIQEAACIRDTKTAAKTPAEDIAAKSIQLSAYALAMRSIDGIEPEKVKLDYLIDTNTPAAKTFEATRGEADYQALLARVEVFSLALEKGVFVPVEPEHWACSAKFCGYFHTCRFAVKRPTQFAIKGE